MVIRVGSGLSVIQVRRRYPFTAPTPTNYLWPIALGPLAAGGLLSYPNKSGLSARQRVSPKPQPRVGQL